MMIQDGSISQTRRLPLLIIAPWSCGRWGTRWTSDDESSREDWVCLSRRLGSAFEWHDTEAYRGAADCTDSVNHRWHFFLFLLCNYINNMFGVNLRELTGGGWKIHSSPPLFFFTCFLSLLLIVFRLCDVTIIVIKIPTRIITGSSPWFFIQVASRKNGATPN